MSRMRTKKKKKKLSIRRSCDWQRQGQGRGRRQATHRRQNCRDKRLERQAPLQVQVMTRPNRQARPCIVMWCWYRGLDLSLSLPLLVLVLVLVLVLAVRYRQVKICSIHSLLAMNGQGLATVGTHRQAGPVSCRLSRQNRSGGSGSLAQEAPLAGQSR